MKRSAVLAIAALTAAVFATTSSSALAQTENDEAVVLMEAVDSAGAAEEAPRAGEGAPSGDTLNDANNPLADIVTASIHNYYAPRLTEVPDATSNTLWLRTVAPIGRFLPRLSVPFKTVNGPTGSVSGVGDLSIFGSIVVTPDDSKVMFGVGPLYVAPTATDPTLGSDTHQLGLAALMVWAEGPLLFGWLLTEQSSVTDRDSAGATDLLAFQYFAMFQMGAGFYIRSAPIMLVELGDGDYNIPFSLGIGKVLIIRQTVLNAFIEPTFTVASNWAGTPAFQVFAGLNFQFLTGDRRH